LLAAACAALLLVRLPSLAQPAGADQALYAYVGQRILDGGQPYRDAWDQKPPGIHFAYALMWRLWPHESVVPAADLALAAITAVLLIPLGRAVTGSEAAGWTSALIFLLLGNPALARLGGVRVRSQAEVFIALFITAALVLVARVRPVAADRSDPSRFAALGAGLLLGLAVVFKYNAAVYAVPLAFGAFVLDAESRRPSAAWFRSLVVLAAGALVIPLGTVAHFAYHGAFDDFLRATVTYNVQYSGETYHGPLHAVSYLLTFPIGYARVDPLWLVGGAGCAVLLFLGAGKRALWLPVAWVAAACLSIAINGSRGLPQYFVQAGPGLALAAGCAAALAWQRVGRAVRIAAIVLIAIAVWRVGDFGRGGDYTSYDLAGVLGRVDRDTYLARYGRADSGDKYSALAVHQLADYLRAHSSDRDRVFVFGFSPWAYVGSDRVSASRFFWSRPVIVGFEASEPRYGVRGLLDDLQTSAPRIVVLQHRDWDPDGLNSDEFWRTQPSLVAWLNAHYVKTTDLHNFEIWTRQASS